MNNIIERKFSKSGEINMEKTKLCWPVGIFDSDKCRCSSNGKSERSNKSLMPNAYWYLQLTRNETVFLLARLWRMRDTLPWYLMGRNENILPARSEVINPAARYVIVNEELALICPTLSIFGCLAVPSLHLIKYFINSYRLILTISNRYHIF